jgi:PKD repeat protein
MKRLAPIAVLSVTVVQMATVAGAAAATTSVYVDKTMSTCSDTGTGTATAPYCTITKAVSKLQPGYTVLIGDGSYAETIKPAVSGTSTTPVTITGWPGKHPSIGAGMTNGAYLASTQYVTISNLLFSGTRGDAISVSSSDHITITGNEVTKAGIPVQGSTARGIALKGTTSSLVSHNFTHDNSDTGIFLGSSTTATTVAYNESSLNAKGYQRNANGIDVVSPGNLIIGNITHDNEDSGIQFYTGGNNNVATLNVTYNNGDHGIDDLNVTGGVLVGNTVYRNCTTGINVEGTSGNYVVENNVAVDNGVYPAYKGISCSRRAGNIGIWDSAPASTVVDHNLVWLTKSGTMYAFKSTYSSLAAMQAATHQESHGVQADPLFAGASSGDLTIGAGSPAIDRADSGAPDEQSVDVLGDPRVEDPATSDTHAEGPRLFDDLGAYEFQPGSSPAPAPPSAPTARLSASPTSGNTPLLVSADASASTDPQGQALTYSFDFGDGTTVPATGTQSAATATHTYANAGTYQLTVTVSDTAGLTSTASQTITTTAPAPPPSGAAPAFVASVANNYSTSTHTSGYITVWRSGGVTAGDLVVLTLQLSGTSAGGAVTGTDAAGNTYTDVSDVAGASGDRLVILAGPATKPLAANDKITVSFPSATAYRLGGDEFSGISRADGSAASTGASGSFSSGAAQATVGNEIAFAAVSVPSGTASPSWSAGWRDLGSNVVGSRYLGRAYEPAPSAGAYTATGTASGAWLSAVVTLQP